MNAKNYLRIAAILMLLHTIGHTFGTLSWDSNPNPAVRQTISQMKTEHFDFMGRSSTLAGFYQGYGLIFIFVLLMISIQLWLLSRRPNKPVLIVMSAFLVILAILEYRYFFPFAAGITGLAAILATLGTYRLANKQ